MVPEDLIISEIRVCWEDQEFCHSVLIHRGKLFALSLNSLSFLYSFLIAIHNFNFVFNGYFAPLKVLVLVDLVSFKRELHAAFLNEVQIFKGIPVVDDHTIRQEDLRFKACNKLACELHSSFEISVVEQIEEVRNKICHQGVDQSVSNPRFLLGVELTLSETDEVILVALLCVHQNSSKKNFIQDFLLSAFLKFMEPFFNFVLSFIDDDLQVTIRTHHAVDGAHQPRKDSNT